VASAQLWLSTCAANGVWRLGPVNALEARGAEVIPVLIGDVNSTLTCALVTAEQGDLCQDDGIAARRKVLFFGVLDRYGNQAAAAFRKGHSE
jgi:hypothetical protein